MGDLLDLVTIRLRFTDIRRPDVLALIRDCILMGPYPADGLMWPATPSGDGLLFKPAQSTHGLTVGQAVKEPPLFVQVPETLLAERRLHRTERGIHGTEDPPETGRDPAEGTITI